MDETALQLHRRQRLEQAVAHLTAGNVTALGRQLGYRDGAFVRQMLAGTRAISDKTVRTIEALRGMSDWFDPKSAVARVGVAEAPVLYQPDARAAASPWVLIPTVNLQLQQGVAGYKIRSKDNDEGPLVTFPQDWMASRGYRSGDLLALRVRDDSMQPALHQDDVVAVDTLQVEPLDGQVFVVNYEGACLMRRLLRDGGVWWLVADNPSRFPRRALTSPHAFLIGRVIHQQGEII